MLTRDIAKRRAEANIAIEEKLPELAGVNTDRLDAIGRLSLSGQGPSTKQPLENLAYQQEITAALVEVLITQQERLEKLEAQVKKDAKK